jgi:hypothetical protein
MKYVLSFVLIVLTFLSCSTRKTDSIEELASIISDYLSNSQVKKLANECSIKADHVYDYQKELYESESSSSLQLNKELTDEMLEDAAVEVIQKFIYSYEDLLEGEFSSWSSKTDNSDKFTSLILWVSKNGQYHGIYIHAVIETKDGFRVMDWLGPSVYPDREIRKKRANLVVKSKEECTFPRTGISFEYEIIY